MRIYVKDINGQKLMDVQTEGNVALTLDRIYEVGDVVVFETSNPYVTIHVDDHVMDSHVFIPKGRLEYAIPFGEKKKAYHPEAFAGEKHLITIAETSEDILTSRRNIALNGLDKRDVATCYPHSDANIMTRDESVFESRNAIDGYKATEGHGKFPYHSWGGGLRDDLELEIDFGRIVSIDEIVLYLRADYVDDHDINWESAVIEFSDGSEMPIQMVKTTSPQSYGFDTKQVCWIKLTKLKREVSSAYSALSQIEVFGVDNIK